MTVLGFLPAVPGILGPIGNFCKYEYILFTAGYSYPAVKKPIPTPLVVEYMADTQTGYTKKYTNIQQVDVQK